MDTRKREQIQSQKDHEDTKRIKTDSNESSSPKTSISTLLVPRVVAGLVPRQATGAKVTLAKGRSLVKRKAPAAFPTLTSSKPVPPKDLDTNTTNAAQGATSQASVSTAINNNRADPPLQLATHKGQQVSQQQQQQHGSNSAENPVDGAHVETIDSDAARRLREIIPRPQNHTVTRIKKNQRQEFSFPYGNYPKYYEGRVRGVTGVEAQGKRQVKVRCPTDLLLFRKETLSSLATASPVSSTSGSSKKASSATPVREWYREHAKMVDPRLEFLEPQWFRFKRVLDIGCNSGLLTLFIGLHYQPKRIQGVDIDSALIQQATNFVLKTYSKLAPNAYPRPKTKSGEQALSYSEYKNHHPQLISTDASTLAKDEKIQMTERGGDMELLSNLDTLPYYEDYFPRSMSVIHGYLPIPKKTDESKYVFPHNMEFRVADWVTASEADEDLSRDSKSSENAEEDLWDVILGFSLTKWIHLHHGDTGIKQFFHKVYRSLSPGGIFLLEPQKLSTYTKRAKLMPEMHKTYLNIKFRPEQFEQFLLEEVGFQRVVHLGSIETKAKNLGRPIMMFCK